MSQCSFGHNWNSVPLLKNGIANMEIIRQGSTGPSRETVRTTRGTRCAAGSTAGPGTRRGCTGPYRGTERTTRGPSYPEVSTIG